MGIGDRGRKMGTGIGDRGMRGKKGGEGRRRARVELR